MGSDPCFRRCSLIHMLFQRVSFPNLPSIPTLIFGCFLSLAGIILGGHGGTITIDKLMGAVVFASHIFGYPLGRRTLWFPDIQGVELKETELEGVFHIGFGELRGYRYYEISLLTQGEDLLGQKEEAKEFAERIVYLLGKEVKRTAERK